MSEEDRLAQAVELVKADNRAEAQEIVAEVIRANRNNARAWILMAKIVDDPQKALQCWQQVARLKPDDPRVQQEIAALKGEPIAQAQPSAEPPGAPPALPAAPIEQKRKTRLPLLIGGGVAVVVVVCGVALVIASMIAQPYLNSQATSAAGAATTIAEQNRPTGAPIPATATTSEQSRPTVIPTSATAVSSGLNLPTAVPATATATTAPTATSRPVATNTPIPASTAKPTDTLLPPTATQPPIVFKPGTYLVGADIQPGIYRGEAVSNASCYWARLEDLSGSADAVIADSDSIGQFYVEIRNSDYALETECELVPLASTPASTGGFPQVIEPGMYLIGRDIQAGTYNGQAGDDFCYWERLSDVAGELDSVIDNDYVVEQFSVQVAASDFALLTTCGLERVAD